MLFRRCSGLVYGMFRYQSGHDNVVQALFMQCQVKYGLVSFKLRHYSGVIKAIIGKIKILVTISIELMSRTQCQQLCQLEYDLAHTSLLLLWRLQVNSELFRRRIRTSCWVTNCGVRQFL